MSTKLFFVNNASGIPVYHSGHNNPNMSGVGVGWGIFLIRTLPGASLATGSTISVAGPTVGLDLQVSSQYSEWISLPIDQDITISGTITLNVWAAENNNSANACVNGIVQRLDSTGAIVSTIGQSANTTELNLSTRTANVLTITPTSTNMKKGDRFRIRLYFDDAASGNMGPGVALTFGFNGPTTGADGDTYIIFTENFGFLQEPGGSNLHLTSAPGPDVGSADEREMWTTRGGAATTAVVNTVSGWTNPVQWTSTAGGPFIEWYSKPLSAFTLSGTVRLNLRLHESNTNANAGARAELAVCNEDGSGAVVWGAINLVDAVGLGGTAASGTSPTGELTAVQIAVRSWISGPDLAITNGQRLRLRCYINDIATTQIAAGFTATLTYNGPTANASGDSRIQLPQTVTEYVAPAGGKIKVWNGSAWVEKPMKVWNGSAWVEKPVKFWNGSSWVLS